MQSSIYINIKARKEEVSTIMNVEGSPIQLCRQGHSCSSMGSRGGIDITEVTIKEQNNNNKKHKKEIIIRSYEYDKFL